MARSTSAFFLMRLRYIVSAPHRHGREARKPAAGTFTGLPHTHMHAHTPSTPPHTCTNGNSLNVGVAHTNMHIYTHTHTFQPYPGPFAKLYHKAN